jgi:exoribonuclease R
MKAGTMNKIVGILELASKYRYGLTKRGHPLYLFTPYDTTLPNYVVGSTEKDTSVNRIAVIEPSSEPVKGTDKPRGNLIRFLGNVGDYEAERLALLEHYCPNGQGHHHSPIQSPKRETIERELLDESTGWTTFHIDPAGCRDIDDALAWHAATKTWAITIADAAAAVPVGSDLDETAKAMGATFYDLEGRALRPMLPAVISEDAASLLPGRERKGVTLFITDQGRQRFALTTITVQHSFTYESFMESPLAATLAEAYGKGVSDSHKWIENAMLAYNTAVARRLKVAGVGLLRVQAAAEANPVLQAIDPALAAEAASYEPANPTREQRHASLDREAYCHASSPLRRYADLVNQRALKALLAGESVTPTEVATHLNERGKAQKRWQRDLTFLTHVTPGRVHTIDVTWISSTEVWVPLWRRVIRLRHEQAEAPGVTGKIDIFCDPTKRNWKQRILTSATS